jgi:hypothetical protein
MKLVNELGHPSASNIPQPSDESICYPLDLRIGARCKETRGEQNDHPGSISFEPALLDTLQKTPELFKQCKSEQWVRKVSMVFPAAIVGR